MVRWGIFLIDECYEMLVHISPTYCQKVQSVIFSVPFMSSLFFGLVLHFNPCPLPFFKKNKRHFYLFYLLHLHLGLSLYGRGCDIEVPDGLSPTGPTRNILLGPKTVDDIIISFFSWRNKKGIDQFIANTGDNWHFSVRAVLSCWQAF